MTLRSALWLPLAAALAAGAWAACSSPPRFQGAGVEDACAARGAFAGADRARGRAVFDRDCAQCHSLEGGAQPQGPDLQGVVGRRIGGVPGFRYSKEFRNREDLWTLAALDRYLEDPEWSFPGTRMRYLGLVDPGERRDLIALLACPAP